ncbi:hypothetical protein [Sinorhizobium alkalisoli]|uniref:hypothetical protein n=1 Tax=Sinorhizobium alkalisoli TaxID=1752398 RepID=UPI0013F4DD4D|nr:hypothetical protein [Sinorhizobium alkalisoli]
MAVAITAGSPTTTLRRRSVRASIVFATISGPIPDGSPMVTASGGKVFMRVPFQFGEWCRRHCAASWWNRSGLLSWQAASFVHQQDERSRGEAGLAFADQIEGVNGQPLQKGVHRFSARCDDGVVSMPG